MATKREDTIRFEGTIGDVKMHNSRLDDNSWVDLTIRVAGEHGVTAAMALYRAKNKLVTVEYELDNASDR